MAGGTFSDKTDEDAGATYNDDETVTLSGSMVFGNQLYNCHDVAGC